MSGDFDCKDLDISECLKDKLLKNEGFIIFYSNGCPFCDNALIELRKTNKVYKGYNFKNNKVTKETILNNLKNLKINIKNKKQLESHTTKPIIFYKNLFIGGFDDLKKFLNSNKLN